MKENEGGKGNYWKTGERNAVGTPEAQKGKIQTKRFKA